MEQYRSARKFGVFVICLTLLFRALELGLPQTAISLLRLLPKTQKIQTDAGQEARRFSFAFPFPIESSPPSDYSPEPTLPTFTSEQAQSIEVTNDGGKEADLGELLAQELDWTLAGDEPTVLILHTHTSESYEKDGADYEETADYRTLDENYNMLSIGDRVAELLEAEGISVVHDREFHDYPSYNSAYTNARKTIQANLQEYPSIVLVLDLHRDAAEDGGKQLTSHVDIDGQSCAQLMTVLGVGRNGLENNQWEDNLSLALKLQLLLEEQASGITRPISLRPQRFNQDLAAYTLLVEVGTAGNTHSEAMLAAEQLAQAIITLKDGSE